jgi:hypothetical protein
MCIFMHVSVLLLRSPIANFDTKNVYIFTDTYAYIAAIISVITIHKGANTYIHIYVYTSRCICIYICMYMHIHIQIYNYM